MGDDDKERVKLIPGGPRRPFIFLSDVAAQGIGDLLILWNTCCLRLCSVWMIQTIIPITSTVILCSLNVRVLQLKGICLKTLTSPWRLTTSTVSRLCPKSSLYTLHCVTICCWHVFLNKKSWCAKWPSRTQLTNCIVCIGLLGNNAKGKEKNGCAPHGWYLCCQQNWGHTREEEWNHENIGLCCETKGQTNQYADCMTGGTYVYCLLKATVLDPNTNGNDGL